MNQSQITGQASRDAVDAAIKRRVTEKVLAENPVWPDQSKIDSVDTSDQHVLDSIIVAGFAPFHYDRRVDNVAEPWRMYTLFHKNCRGLAADFDRIATDVKPGNKIPRMLNACGALVLVTWLRETDSANPKLEKINHEHLAATAAAVQNLLLALTVRGLGTYWSSGGPLGSPEIFQKLSIAENESLIAAVFVDYPCISAGADVDRIPGKNREKRANADHWSREVHYR